MPPLAAQPVILICSTGGNPDAATAACRMSGIHPGRTSNAAQGAMVSWCSKSKSLTVIASIPCLESCVDVSLAPRFFLPVVGLDLLAGEAFFHEDVADRFAAG